jgi:MFS family permease
MRRPSLLKSKSTTPGEPQVVEFALDPAVAVENGTDGDQIDEPPPEGGYGWVVCGAVSLINGFTWGVAAVRLFPPLAHGTQKLTTPESYGVYLSYYLSTAHFPTATPMDYAFIGGLIFGCALLFSPLWTILTRELGRKLVMTGGCVLMAAGFVAASFATQPWQLYLSQGAAVGTGMGAIFTPSVQVVPQWFLRRRSLAGGIASAGSGFGGIAFALATDAMIRKLSLAWALRITGVCCLVGNLVGTALIRDRNAQVKPPQLGFATHLLKRYDCLLLLAWAFTNILGYIVILYSVSSYAVQVAGLTQKQAGILTAVLNLGSGIGRPAAGVISDRFGRIQVAAYITLACAISVFAIWIPATSYGVLIFFSLVSGAILGGE